MVVEWSLVVVDFAGAKLVGCVDREKETVTGVVRGLREKDVVGLAGVVQVEVA